MSDWHFIERIAGKDAICKCGITGKHLNSSQCREKFCAIKTEYLILRSWTCLFRLWLIVFRVAERLWCLGAAARCTVCCDLKKQTRLLMEVTAAFVCGVSFYLCILWIMRVLTWFSCLFLPVCFRAIWKKGCIRVTFDLSLSNRDILIVKLKSFCGIDSISVQFNSMCSCVLIDCNLFANTWTHKD